MLGLKWIGNQKGVEGLPGIPARDLSEEEVEALGGESVLLETGLYEAAKGKIKAAPKTVAENRLPSELSWLSESEAKPDEVDNTI